MSQSRSRKVAGAFWMVNFSILLVYLLGRGHITQQEVGSLDVGAMEHNLVQMLNEMGHQIVQTQVASSENIHWFGKPQGEADSNRESSDSSSSTWLQSVWPSRSGGDGDVAADHHHSPYSTSPSLGVFLFQGTPATILFDSSASSPSSRKGARVKSSSPSPPPFAQKGEATTQSGVEGSEIEEDDDGISAEVSTVVTAFASLRHLCQNHSLVFSKQRKIYAAAETQVTESENALKKVELEKWELSRELEATKSELSDRLGSWTTAEWLLGLTTLGLLGAFVYHYELGKKQEEQTASLAEEVASGRETIRELHQISKALSPTSPPSPLVPPILKVESFDESIVTPTDSAISPVQAFASPTPRRRTTTTTDSRRMLTSSPFPAKHGPSGSLNETGPLGSGHGGVGLGITVSPRSLPLTLLVPPPTFSHGAGLGRQDMKYVRAQMRELLNLRFQLSISLHYQMCETTFSKEVNQTQSVTRLSSATGIGKKTIGVQVKPKVRRLSDGTEGVESPWARRNSQLAGELEMSLVHAAEKDEAIEILMEEKEELQVQYSVNADKLLEGQSTLAELLAVREEEVETLKANVDTSVEWQKRTEHLTAQLIDDNQRFREEHDQLRSKGLALMSRMSHMTEELSEKDSVCMRLQGELRANQLEMEQTKLDWMEEKATLQLAGQQVHLQLQHGEGTLEERDVQMAELKEDRARLQAEVDRMKERGFDVLEQLAESTKQLQERDNLVLTLHEKLRDQEKQSDVCIHALSEERSTLTLQLQAAQTEHQTSEKQLHDTTEKANQIIQTLQDREVEIAGQLQEQNNKTLDLNTSQSLVQEQLDTAVHELALANQALAHGREQRQLLAEIHQKELDAVEGELEDVKQQAEEQKTAIETAHIEALASLKQAHNTAEDAAHKATKRLRKEMAEMQRLNEVRANEAQLLVEMERRTRLEAEEESETTILETQDEATSEVVRLALNCLIHEQQCVRRLRMAQENADWAEMRVGLMERLSNTAFTTVDTLQHDLSLRDANDRSAKGQLVDLSGKVKEIEIDHRHLQEATAFQDTQVKRLQSELSQGNRDKALQLAVLTSHSESLLQHMEWIAQAQTEALHEKAMLLTASMKLATHATLVGLQPAPPVQTTTRGVQSLFSLLATVECQTTLGGDDLAAIQAKAAKSETPIKAAATKVAKTPSPTKTPPRRVFMPSLVSMKKAPPHASPRKASPPKPVLVKRVVEGEQSPAPAAAAAPQHHKDGHKDHPGDDDIEHRSVSQTACEREAPIPTTAAAIPMRSQQWDYSPEPAGQEPARYAAPRGGPEDVDGDAFEEEEEEEEDPEWVRYHEREKRLASVLEATLEKHLNQGKQQVQHRMGSPKTAMVVSSTLTDRRSESHDSPPRPHAVANGGAAPTMAAHRYDLPITSVPHTSRGGPNHQSDLRTTEEKHLGVDRHSTPTSPVATKKPMTAAPSGSESLLMMVRDAAAKHKEAAAQSQGRRSFLEGEEPSTQAQVTEPSPSSSSPSPTRGRSGSHHDDVTTPRGEVRSGVRSGSGPVLSILLGHGKVKASSQAPHREAPPPPFSPDGAQLNAVGTDAITETVKKLLLGGSASTPTPTASRPPLSHHHHHNNHQGREGGDTHREVSPPGNGGSTAVFRAEVMDIEEYL